MSLQQMLLTQRSFNSCCLVKPPTAESLMICCRGFVQPRAFSSMPADSASVLWVNIAALAPAQPLTYSRLKQIYYQRF